MVTHPDRGGNTDDFKKVSIAYALLLKKLKDKDSDALHVDLKDGSKEYIKNQNNNPHRNNLTEKFDSELFNKIYEENRIEDIYDTGYGEWMKENKIDSKAPTKLFNGNFNKNMFNNEFDKYKKEQQAKLDKSIINYEEPNINISYKNKDSIMFLGKCKIDNFSGEAGGLLFTDYKDAYTNSCLIDINSIKISGKSKTLLDKKAERKNISYQMSEKDIQKQEIKRLKEELE